MHTRELLVGVPNGTLLDFETTGLDETTNEIITTGVVFGNTLRILQRKTREKDYFYRRSKELLSKAPQPFYAYNVSFEQKFLRAHLGIEAKTVDIFTPWKVRADAIRLKWPKLDDLLPHPEIYYSGKVTTGADIPPLWQKYLETKEERYLHEIVRHNEIDLLRELMLMVHYPI
jgi:DNA polymerase III epsilon subunit-like protein